MSRKTRYFISLSEDIYDSTQYIIVHMCNLYCMSTRKVGRHIRAFLPPLIVLYLIARFNFGVVTLALIDLIIYRLREIIVSTFTRLSNYH